MIRHRLGIWRPAAALWVAAVAWLTLRPDPTARWAAEASPWWCLPCGDAGIADLVLNIVLFIPLGMILAARATRLWKAFTLAAATSLAIELVQATCLAGRDAALADLVANTLGGILGWWVLVAWGDASRRVRIIKRATLAVPITFALQLAATLWLVPFAPPPGEPWRVELPPGIRHRVNVPGTVTRLEVAGRRLVGEMPAGTSETAATSVGLQSAFTVNRPIDTATAVVRVIDRNGWVFAAVDVSTSHLRASLRLRGGALRLRTPGWVVPLPSAPRSSDTVRVALDRDGSTVRLSVQVRSESATVVVRLGAQHGWVLLNPFAPAGGTPAWRWWTLAWLAGWGVLLGLAARGARHPPVVGGIALVGLLLITGIGGAPLRLDEGVVFALGWLAGLSSARPRRSPAGA